MEKPLNETENKPEKESKAVPTDKELKRRKLETETNPFLVYIVPLLPLFSTILIVGATIYVGIKTDFLKMQTATNDSTKVRLDIQKENSINAETLADITRSNKDSLQIMRGLELVRSNYKLEKESDILNDKKRGLNFENNRLTNANNALQNTVKEANDKLKYTQAKSDQLDEALKQSSFNEAFWKEEKGFSRYEYHLTILKEDLLNDKRFSADFLANGIKNDRNYSKRIIDSVVKLPSSGRKYTYGMANFILYLGTRNEFYLNLILDEIRNRTISSYQTIDYSMFTSNAWKESDVKKIILTIGEVLSSNRPRQDAYFFLIHLANIQDTHAHLRFNLDNLDFALFLKYISLCRELYNSEDIINKNIAEARNNKINLLRCLLINSPQIFLARSLSETHKSLSYLKPIFSKRLSVDTSKLDMDKLTNLASIVEKMQYSETTNSKLAGYKIIVKNKVDKMLNPKIIKGKKFTLLELEKASLEYVKIYNDFFEHKEISLEELRMRIKAELL